MDHSNTIIDFFLSSHLGDALCSTPLAAQVCASRGQMPLVVSHPSTRSVFANNPHIAGFTNKRGSRLYDLMKGHGHMIQRLQRGLGLPVSILPRPEIYLSPEEQQWAAAERLRWPTDRPVCLLSARVVTQARYYGEVDWQTVANTWGEHCTVIQPVITGQQPYRDQIGLIRRPEEWHEERPANGVIVHRDLPLRQYMALFSVADYFCGGLAGGAHVAAAIDVPALILLWAEQYDKLSFPSRSLNRLATENWPYPYHDYFRCEDIHHGCELHAFRDAVAKTMATPRGAPIPSPK
jgi:hypothetical protein